MPLPDRSDSVPPPHTQPDDCTMTDPRLQRIPIVAISASVMKDERNQARQAGCVGFLEKPFDIQELRRVVAEAIASGAARAGG